MRHFKSPRSGLTEPPPKAQQRRVIAQAGHIGAAALKACVLQRQKWLKKVLEKIPQKEGGVSWCTAVQSIFS